MEEKDEIMEDREGGGGCPKTVILLIKQPFGYAFSL